MTLRKLNQTKIGVNNFQRCFVCFFEEPRERNRVIFIFFVLFNLIPIPPLNPTAMCV